MIAELLQTGSENALTAADISETTGYSIRKIVRLVKDERAEGKIILSGSCGYYLPGSDSEIRRFAESMKKRALSSFQARRSAAEALKQTEGQLEL